MNFKHKFRVRSTKGKSAPGNDGECRNNGDCREIYNEITAHCVYGICCSEVWGDDCSKIKSPTERMDRVNKWVAETNSIPGYNPPCTDSNCGGNVCGDGERCNRMSDDPQTCICGNSSGIDNDRDCFDNIHSSTIVDGKQCFDLTDCNGHCEEFCAQRGPNALLLVHFCKDNNCGCCCTHNG